MKNKILKIILFSIIPSFIFYISGRKILSIVFFCFIVLFGILDITCPFFHNNFQKFLKISADKLSKTILYAGYILTVIPVGFLSKISKRDRLKINKQQKNSYWIDENQNYDYERQF